MTSTSNAAVFRVGNGAGFSGDRVGAPGPVVDTLIARGGPAALFFEVLGERTVALAQLEKRRNPAREVLALLCCGPAGNGGARWRTTQRIRTQSYLVPRGAVEHRVTVGTAKELA